MSYSPLEAHHAYDEAATAFHEGRLPDAIAGLERLVENGHGSADVLYALGTAQLQAGDLGHAILHLEQARRLGGGSDDLDANLALAREKQLDKVVGGEEVDSLAERIAAATPAGLMGHGFLGLWLVAGLLACAALLSRRRRVTLWLATALAVLACIPLGLATAAHVWVHEGLTQGVVTAQTLPARDRPDRAGRVAFEVHAGLKVRLLDDQGDFVQIRLPNGLSGWAERKGVTQL
jgi:hypothetical protein